MLFTSSYVEDFATHQANMSRGAAGLLGGAIGGAAQAYLAMYVCPLRTTRSEPDPPVCVCARQGRLHAHEDGRDHAQQDPRQSRKGSRAPDRCRRPACVDLRSLYGDLAQGWNSWDQQGSQRRRAASGEQSRETVTLIAFPLWLTGLVWRAPPPQATNWSSRIGIARAAEQTIKELGHKKPGEPLTPTEKVTASAIGASRSPLLALVHRPRCQLTEGKPSLADGVARTHQVALSDAGTTRLK